MSADGANQTGRSKSRRNRREAARALGPEIRADILHDLVLNHTRPVTAVIEQDLTVEQAINTLRQAGPSEGVLYFYVVDSEQRLVGVVPVRRFITSPPDKRVADVMLAEVISLPAWATVLEACELFLEHHLLAIPVVDARRRVLGILDVTLFTSEIGALAQRQQVANVFQLIGVHVAVGRKVPAWFGFKDRFPWLLCNIASGLVCAFIASRFELLLSEVVLLALFLTVVLALGESVSMQSMTLTLQRLIGHRVTWALVWSSLKTEVATSAMLGAGCGLLLGAIVAVWKRHGWAAVVVGASVNLSILTACLLGVALPTLVKLLRIDPKVAAGPIVLALADISTLLYYFGMAQWLLV